MIWVCITAWLTGWAVTLGVAFYHDYKHGYPPDFPFMCFAALMSLIAWPALAVMVFVDLWHH